MDEPFNPYAAPKTLPNDVRHDVQKPRRPRSLKWATFVFGDDTCVRISDYWDAVENNGLADVVSHLDWQDAEGILMAAGWITCLLNKRNAASFYLTVVLLGVCTLATAYTLTAYEFPPVLTKKYSIPLYSILGTIFGSVACLFYRVAFGLPSRLYFGMETPLTDGTVPQKSTSHETLSP